MNFIVVEKDREGKLLLGSVAMADFVFVDYGHVIKVRKDRYDLFVSQFDLDDFKMVMTILEDLDYAGLEKAVVDNIDSGLINHYWKTRLTIK